ncbi:MAG: hypothetical protein M1833_005904 [Piccolia ochrophora]|nr:MAG: hypothetical protein M1833_005904 [Piccolia ochrophora]
MSRLSDLLNPAPSSESSTPAPAESLRDEQDAGVGEKGAPRSDVERPQEQQTGERVPTAPEIHDRTSVNNTAQSNSIDPEHSRHDRIAHSSHSPKHPLSTTRPSVASPVEPPPSFEPGQPSTPTLDQYHHASGSPTQPPTHADQRSRSPSAKLPPLQSVSSPSREPLTSTPPPAIDRPIQQEQPEQSPVADVDSTAAVDNMEDVQVGVKEETLDKKTEDVSTADPPRQLSPDPAMPSVDGPAPSPVPRVKTEPSVTPREATPATPIPAVDTRKAALEGSVDPSTETLEVKGTSTKNLKGSSTNASTPTSETFSSTAAKPPPKKRPAPKSTSTKKGPAAALKKPQAKKRKLDSESVERSVTPASSRASKTPAASNRKQSVTPAPSTSSPVPGEDYMDEDGDVFCICRRPDNHTWMIGCDGGCEDWFHGACVKIDEEDGDLIDKYICPNCESNGKGNTTWKPMCRLDGCRQPARLTKKSLSKYCSDEHGREFMRQRVPRSTIRVGHGPSAENDDESEPEVGGVLHKGQLAAVAKGVDNVSEFRNLGEGVLSPPPTAVPDENGDTKMEDGEGNAGTFFNDEEWRRNEDIEKEKETLVQRRILLKDRERFLQLVKDRSKHILEQLNNVKDICGYDSRLSWTDEEFLAWRSSEEGEKAFTTGELEPSESATTEEEGGDGVCQKKRCERHKQWRNIQIQDIRFEESKVADEMRRLKQEEADLRQRAKLRRIREADGDREGRVEMVSSVDGQRDSLRWAPRLGFKLPAGTRRPRKSIEITEDVQPLEHPSLGSPSEVILLRDSKRRYPSPVSKDAPETDTPGQRTGLNASELWEFIDAETGHTRLEEVVENIYGLRLGEPGSIHKKAELEEAAKVLHRGFKAAQLAHYVEEHNKTEAWERDVARGGAERQESASAKQSEWMPSTSPFTGEDTVSVESRLYGGLTRKEAVIWRVIRGCWKLQVKEEVESIGELELTVEPLQLTVLLNGSRNVLKDLAERRNAKLDVSRSRNVIRVTANRSIASYVAEDIQGLLASIQCTKLDMRPLQELAGGEETLKPEVLSSISDISGSVSELSEENEVSIYHLGENSTAGHDATRILMSLYPLDVNTFSTFIHNDQHATGESVLVPVGQREELGWKSRHKEWARLQRAIHAVGKDVEQPQGADTPEAPQRSHAEVASHDFLTQLPNLESPEDTQRGGVIGPDQVDSALGRIYTSTGPTGHDALSLKQSTSSLDGRVARWKESTDVDTDALIGQLLYETPRQTTISPANVNDLFNVPSNERVFASTAPNLLSTLSTLDHIPHAKTEHLYIHLQPSPWASPSTAALPHLELVVAVDHTSSTPRLVKASAIISRRLATIALPSLPADVQLESRLSLKLRNPRSASALTDFLARSHLDVHGQQRLQTPAALTLDIPSWAVIPATHSTPAHSQSTSMIPTPYLFTSLTYAQTALYTHNSFLLAYHYLESGRTGGRRTELRVLKDWLVRPKRHTSRRFDILSDDYHGGGGGGGGGGDYDIIPPPRDPALLREWRATAAGGAESEDFGMWLQTTGAVVAGLRDGVVPRTSVGLGGGGARKRPLGEWVEDYERRGGSRRSVGHGDVDVLFDGEDEYGGFR